MLGSFVACLLLFLAVGLASARKRKNNQEDYYLASRSVPPWLVGLSAVATNNSGYMFIGVIGYTYAVGLSAGLLMLGWILGDFIASLYVHKKLRAVAEASSESSYIAALSQWAAFPTKYYRWVAASLSLIFLLAYASAQLVAGGKALQVLLHWPDWMGAIVGALLVMFYCVAGGIRASIWTDAAQSVVMILAMGLMLASVYSALGGLDNIISAMRAIDGYLTLAPASAVLPGFSGVILFFCSWLIAGFSVIAQPHIMVRFMALNSDKGFVQTRLWYYLWFVVFYVMATAVGLLARIYLPDTQHFDAELALPTMAVELLPPVFVGIVLAGIFAATISTADSLLLSCSAFLSQDLLPSFFANKYGVKIATLLVTLMALLWAVFNQQTVFALVILSWAMLSACFVPLIILLLFKQSVSPLMALMMMFVGFVSVLTLHGFGILTGVFVGMPAIIISLLLYAICAFIYRYKSSH